MKHAAIAQAAATLVLLFAAPGQALHCNGDITTIGTGVETLYIDDRSDEAGEIDHWSYMEDNGIEGLQSGGAIIIEECDFTCIVDPCQHRNPDTLIF